jgi:CheY-like chemotaxis protein
MLQTVVLIDDSPVDRATYQRFLCRDQRQTYQIIEFDTGEDALVWCQGNVADVILLDYQLPEMDGLEFIRQLQQQHPDELLPVILLTGLGNTAIAVEALKLGAQDYLDKN